MSDKYFATTVLFMIYYYTNHRHNRVRLKSGGYLWKKEER